MVRKNANRGFTLIEMMATATMIGILAIFVPRIFQQFNKTAMRTSDQSVMLQNTIVTQYTLSRWLRTAKASTVQISQLPNNPTFSEIDFTTISGDKIQIAESGMDLIVTKNSVQSKLVRSGIKGISFIYPNPNDLQLIQYGMSVSNPNGTMSYSFGAKTVRLDNL